MENLSHITISTPIGNLKLVSDERDLLSVSFVLEMQDASTNQPKILKSTENQLQEYFDGSRKGFDLAINPYGTEFQKRVWKEVCNVNFGKTDTYLNIAKQTGSNKNTRAVGLANGKNPIPIIIPCHRIMGSNGKLTGYSGGLEIKKWLLNHEREHSKNNYLLF